MIQIGDTFGRWTVIAHAPLARNGVPRVVVECSCKVVRPLTCRTLLSGKSKSCGCLRLFKAASSRQLHRWPQTPMDGGEDEWRDPFNV